MSSLALRVSKMFAAREFTSVVRTFIQKRPMINGCISVKISLFIYSWNQNYFHLLTEANIMKYYYKCPNDSKPFIQLLLFWSHCCEQMIYMYIKAMILNLKKPGLDINDTASISFTLSVLFAPLSARHFTCLVAPSSPWWLSSSLTTPRPWPPWPPWPPQPLWPP